MPLRISSASNRTSPIFVIRKFFLYFAASIASALSCTTGAHAQTTFIEQSQAIKAPNAVAKLGSDLFGDHVNLYTGGLEFVQADVELRGNNALRVSAGRRLVTNVAANLTEIHQFGLWELEIPRIHGVFALADGWKVWGGSPYARCSAFSEPPDTSESGALWNATEFWQGNFMYIPGHGDQQLLSRDPSNNIVPTPASNYPVVTAKFWSLSCLPSLANAPTLGEGFLATSPDGTKYRFDHLASFDTPPLGKSVAYGPAMVAGAPALMATAPALVTGIGEGDLPTPNANMSYSLQRAHIYIYPTEVTDRFGNWVRYAYDPANPQRVMSITSSDGRSLNFTYGAGAGTNFITAVTDGTRTWTYAYSGLQLTTVTLPDTSTWNLANIYPLLARLNPAPGCETSSVGNLSIAGAMVHPSGATGSFTLSAKVHGRSDVTNLCGGLGYAPIPKYFYSYSLSAKTITGPGLPTAGYTWSYEYGPPNASWAPCGTGCPKSKTVSVTDPKQDVTRYTFGNQYRISEGRLEQVDTGWNASTSTAQRTTTTRYRAPGAGPYPSMLGYGGEVVSDGEALARLMPADRTVTTQQGVTFTWDAPDFNEYAQPTRAIRSSSLPYARTEYTGYDNNVTLWVLGQVKTVTESSGKVMVSNVYNGATANLESVSKFARQYQTMTYHPDGTLATRSDGLGHSTSFSNYMRGIPQNVAFPDGGTESASVNNIGGIDWTMDPYSNLTRYSYDAMGRLSRITYPANDSVAWNDTIVALEKVGWDEYGLGAGHWRQTVSTGNARTVQYYDALWRPVLTNTADLGNEAATRKMSLRRYDDAGRATFESYAQRTINSILVTLSGKSSSFDALGRPVTVTIDSELGPLTTSFSYLNGFQRSVTNPRNFTTTSSFYALDQPDESAPTNIAAPENVNVAISRDGFGKTTAITRSGGGKSATRSYVYDGEQLLCKTIEPETGATMQAYDPAGNVAWRASGLSLTSATCDVASVPSGKKITFGYDPMNRLTTTAYSDGTPGIARTYTLDGLPATIAADGAVWTNSYNKRRVNERESLAYGGATYNISRAYDANGSLSQLTYPDGSAIGYNPNALGEPQQVGTYATAITYYPDGAIAGFVYGNGIQHSLTQHLRGLPWVSSDTGVFNDSHSYDPNGNVNSIVDNQGGTTSRAMSYDGIDRLKTVTASLWGTAGYDYDSLDNLTLSTISGGGTARSVTFNYPNPASNLLQSVSGSAGYNFNYAYDAQGNITLRDNKQYTFDQGNRMTSAVGRATYRYDGLGHRVSVIGTDGVNRIQVYSQGGQLLYTTSSGGGGTKYVYLHNHVIAEVKK